MNTNIEVQVGMGATVSVGSDSYAGTVVEILRAGAVTIKVQDDATTPGEGHDYYGKQVYNYAPNPKGRVRFFRYDVKANRWREVTEGAKGRFSLVSRSSYYLSLGERRSYSDPSF